MDKIYEVLAYPINPKAEQDSIPYWFGGTPEVVKEYKTKGSALRYGKAYASKHRCAVEVSLEWEDENENRFARFQQFIYPA